MEIIKNIKKIRHNLYRSYYRLKPLEKKKIINMVHISIIYLMLMEEKKLVQHYGMHTIKAF